MESYWSVVLSHKEGTDSLECLNASQKFHETFIALSILEDLEYSEPLITAMNASDVRLDLITRTLNKYIVFLKKSLINDYQREEFDFCPEGISDLFRLQISSGHTCLAKSASCGLIVKPCLRKAQPSEATTASKISHVGITVEHSTSVLA